MSPQHLKYALRLSGTFAVCLVAAGIGPAVSLMGANAPGFRLLAAVSMAGLLLFGREMWPAVFAASIGASLVRGSSPIPSLGIALGNTIEPLVSSTLLTWSGVPRPSFRRLRDTLAFIAGGGFAGPAVAASFWILFQHAVLGIRYSDLLHPWFIWLRSDVVPILLLVPLLLAWREPLDCKLQIKSFGLAMGALAALVLIDMLIFSVEPWRPEHAYVVGYIVFPCLIWIALQFGPHGATLGLVTTGIIAASNTIEGRGPFISPYRPVGVLYIFLAVLAITALIIAATISEHRQAETTLRQDREQLRESEERYRELFENAQDLIAVFDLDGHFISVNNAVLNACSFTQEELLSKTMFDVIKPSSMEVVKAAFTEVLSGKERAGTQLEVLRKNGASLWIEVNARRIERDGVPIGIQSIGRDISWRRRVEEQLLHSQKMEAVGRLAGGVAHDFNNLLGVIIGYSDLLLEEVAANESLRQRVVEIKRAGKRAADVTRQLLAFSRKQVLSPRIIDLNAIVSETTRMLLRLLGEDIELLSKLSPNSPRVKIDPAQMQQVIMNLAINARDAMPRGGKLILETARATLDETAHQGVTVVPGRYAVLTITDTGIGMDEATRLRIFEPFFSTKEELGTGLGLATVYGFVKQSGGYVWVYSEVGRGTTFKI
ncbi:MAG TPA: MASE1 domain-containing protein, partial [Terriglobales bacterium]|nr:MASE1 domain-containing protein [Terriglobales bacterium]